MGQLSRVSGLLVQRARVLLHQLVALQSRWILARLCCGNGRHSGQYDLVSTQDGPHASETAGVRPAGQCCEYPVELIVIERTRQPQL